jgi:hypothetical protein
VLLWRGICRCVITLSPLCGDITDGMWGEACYEPRDRASGLGERIWAGWVGMLAIGGAALYWVPTSIAARRDPWQIAGMRVSRVKLRVDCGSHACCRAWEKKTVRAS